MSKNKIKSSEISVIIQGAVTKDETARCIRSIRKYLPHAEIILSTWQDSETNGLNYDTLVLSKDPDNLGLHYYNNRVVPYNFNRQLVSTQEGLNKAKRKYALKIRSDFFLKNVEFLNFFDLYPIRGSEFKYFKHRVIVPSVFSRSFSEETGFPLPFHPSDFFFFGLREDLMDYFSHCTVLDKKQGCDWHYKLPDRKPYRSETGRYTAEQELCLSWLHWHGIQPNYEDFSDWSEEITELSYKILFNNFIFLNPKSIGLGSTKHSEKLFKAQYNPWYGLITQQIFEQRYREQYDTQFTLHKYKKRNWFYYIVRLLKSAKGL